MMQIIIDANVADEFPKKTKEAIAIVNWIWKRGKLSTGGQNLEELSKTRILQLVIEFIRA
jgi:hypothetical protein